VQGHNVEQDKKDPWVLEMVVQVEKNQPFSRTAAQKAGIGAVNMLLDEGRNDPSLQQALTSWQMGRIRKHVRRARGAKWEQVQALAGYTFESVWEVEGQKVPCKVRALKPNRLNEPNELVNKLQLSGFEPEIDFYNTTSTRLVRVVLNTDLNLPFGKEIAACAHVGQLSWLTMNDGQRAAWVKRKYTVDTLYVNSREFEKLSRKANVKVQDAGFTVVEPGTVTALGFWV